MIFRQFLEIPTSKNYSFHSTPIYLNIKLFYINIKIYRISKNHKNENL